MVLANIACMVCLFGTQHKGASQLSTVLKSSYYHIPIKPRLSCNYIRDNQKNA